MVPRLSGSGELLLCSELLGNPLVVIPVFVCDVESSYVERRLWELYVTAAARFDFGHA